MDHEAYLLLLLSDGNLPTGSFVSSSGLESYFKHGFPHLSNLIDSAPQPPAKIKATIEFIRDSLSSYARLSIPFVSDTHTRVLKCLSEVGSTPQILSTLHELDSLYEAMTLNQITRRASKAQGVALLTLYSKGFSRPLWLKSLCDPSSTDFADEPVQAHALDAVVEKFKLSIRKGDTPGHLPICWGILTAYLDLSLEKSRELFLFLYARSLLSAAIRLNAVGPYAAQQVLLHVIKEIVNEEASKCAHLTTSISIQYESDWDRLERENGPATTWPLGEILAARHDLQHSRIFNS